MMAKVRVHATASVGQVLKHHVLGRAGIVIVEATRGVEVFDLRSAQRSCEFRTGGFLDLTASSQDAWLGHDGSQLIVYYHGRLVSVMCAGTYFGAAIATIRGEPVGVLAQEASDGYELHTFSVARLLAEGVWRRDSVARIDLGSERIRLHGCGSEVAFQDLDDKARHVVVVDIETMSTWTRIDLSGFLAVLTPATALVWSDSSCRFSLLRRTSVRRWEPRWECDVSRWLGPEKRFKTLGVPSALGADFLVPLFSSTAYDAIVLNGDTGDVLSESFAGLAEFGFRNIVGSPHGHFAATLSKTDVCFGTYVR